MYEEPQLPPEGEPLTPLLRRLLDRDPAGRPDVGEVVRFLNQLLATPPTEKKGATKATKATKATEKGERSDSPEWLPRLLTVLVLLAATAVGIVMIVTAIRPGGDTKLPDNTPPPTVAGTSRPPPSPGGSQTPSP